MNGCYLLPGAEFYVGINNKGLWPTLTLLPNGEISAAIYNQPSHGFGCGDVELWISDDQGKSWNFRSVISDHSKNPELTRMNHAIGLNSKSELVALVSGWSEGRAAPILPLQLCVSFDNGHTWSRKTNDNSSRFIPYGKILLGDNDNLICSLYGSDESKNFDSFLCSSSDNGKNWDNIGEIAKGCGEVALIDLANREYLAAARIINSDNLEQGGQVRLFTSGKRGAKWKEGVLISLPMQHPANFLRLHNGNILLTYGSRISGLYGIMMRLSKDDGKTWSIPRPLITIPERTDCGYPSSVQVEDGTIVTAYYMGPKMTPVCLPNGAPWNKSYHMGVARWSLADDTFEYLEEVDWASSIAY